MKKFGKLNPVQRDRMPLAYEKETRTVNFGFEQVQVMNAEADTEMTVYEGYAVQIDGILDYGHIKSQLVEAACAQKDEFGYLNNAVAALIKERGGETLTEDEEADISEFLAFTEYRNLCAQAAKAVLAVYQ
ncbi:MAG: hypothetical protein IJ582_06110 [Prevotella sp.]|nr:hypothetical protein [Prevotella sp.]